MFDSPFDVLALLIAIVAFVIARKAFNRADELRDAARRHAGACRCSAHGRCRRRFPADVRASPRRWPPNSRRRSAQDNAAALAAETPALDPARQGRDRAAAIARASATAACRIPASRSSSAPAGWSGSAA